jgi:hypothetical protein
MIPKYNDIVALIKKGSTLEAQEKIMELREAVLELQEENTEQRRRIEALEQQLAFHKALRFDSPFYYAEGDSVPFCPRCWEADKKAVHLPPPQELMSGTRYDCIECDKMYIHPRSGR